MNEFHKVATLDEIPDDMGHAVEVEGHAIGLFRDGRSVYALDAVCPHRDGPLAEGELDEDVVICPWHGWEFEVRTGACLTDPEHRVRRYSVQVVGDDVLVSLDEPTD